MTTEQQTLVGVFGIKCNVRAPHRFLRMGAMCWLSLTNNGSGNDRFEVIGTSRGGRKVRTWVRACDLHNYRAAWAGPSSKDAMDRGVWSFESREEAVQWAEYVEATYSACPVRPHAAAYATKPVGN